VDTSAGELSLARSLAELETAVAKGLSGIELFSQMTDPALRYALRLDSAPPKLKAAYADAEGALTAALGASLSTMVPSEGRVQIEVDAPQGLGGFLILREYRVPEEGARKPVSEENVERALESILSGTEPPMEPTREMTRKIIRVGIFVQKSGSITKDVYEFPAADIIGTEEAEPGVFAALAALKSRRLRADALAAGVSLDGVYPLGLSELETICRFRCQGRARDEDVAAVLRKIGGTSRAIDLWNGVSRNLDAARRALDVYAREGKAP